MQDWRRGKGGGEREERWGRRERGKVGEERERKGGGVKERERDEREGRGCEGGRVSTHVLTSLR